MTDDLHRLRDVRPATLDHGLDNPHCDLCWRPMADDEFTVIELRVVCEGCQERFEDEADRRFPVHKLNFTIGLVERGYYGRKEGRADPGPNNLGGRP